MRGTLMKLDILTLGASRHNGSTWQKLWTSNACR